MNREILYAGRMLLEPLTDKHTDPMWRAIQESMPELRPFMFWATEKHSYRDQMKFIAEMQVARMEGRDYVYITTLPDGRFAGSVGLHHVNKDHRYGELGFWMNTEFQRRGICTAMAARLLRYAFEELKLHRVYMRHALENEASAAVIRKLGMVAEGRAREEMWVAGRWVTHLTYSLLEQEFPVHRATLLELEKAARI